MTGAYLDNNATTQPLPQVISAMRELLETHWGNPSSGHSLASEPRARLQAARGTVASCLGVTPGEVLFTGGGTESDVMAVVGMALARRDATGADRVAISAIEHPAVTEAAALLERLGFGTDVLPVASDGRIDPAAVADRLGPQTAVCSVMLANNETGAVQPIAQLAGVCRMREVPLHTDAVNAAGKLALDVPALGVAAMSLSAHKFHGPRGVGVLLLRDGTPFVPVFAGGGQEYGLRGGTENVSGIAGLAVALEHATHDLEVKLARMRAQSSRLLERLRELAPDLTLNAPAAEHRLPNTLNISLPGRQGAELAAALSERGVLVSTGAACHHGQVGSAVLRAMGVSLDQARGALRLSVGQHTSDDEVEVALDAFAELLGA